ncbi:MAG: hypothetical protein [Caudovirales sp. ctOwN3]|nr:MAG: hypothetical protein [Caudovirales sp. ctOwN3]
MSYVDVFTGSTIYPSEVSLTKLDLVANVILYWPLEAANGVPVASDIVEITTATSASWTITLPDATNGSLGETILFNNLSAYSITVKNASGTTILSVTSGTQWQVYLHNNTTVAGGWRVYQFGAATSTANAASLVGPGLQASGSTLETTIVTTNATVDTTFVTADRAKLYNWEGALGTFTLPNPAVVGNDWYVLVRNSGTGELTIDPPLTAQINGSSTLQMAIGDSATIITDGTNFFTIGLGQSATFAFDYVVVDISGSTDYTLSGSELNRIAYQFIGAVGADISVIVPNTTQQYWVYDNTTGGFTVSIGTATQVSPLTMVNGTRTIVYSDGTNVVPAVTSFVTGAIDGGTF